MKAAVIDPGTGNIKAGFAGDDVPTSISPSVVGFPRLNAMIGMGNKDAFVGSAAIKKRGMLQLKYPLEHGIVTNWDHMERILSHTFKNELQIDPAETPVLLTDPPLNPLKLKQKRNELLFETFNACSLSTPEQPVLALTATGRTTGVVLDIGDGVSHAVPIIEGNSVPEGIRRMDYGGRDVTDVFMKILGERGYLMTSAAHRESVEAMKKKLSYVALDFAEEKKMAQRSSDVEKTFELPDGEIITVGSERFRCSEILFQPEMLSIVGDGIGSALFKAVSGCNTSIRRRMYGNIVLSGGTTLLPGFAARVEKEVQARIPQSSKATVHAPEGRGLLVWSGASVFASVTTKGPAWATKADYEEHGENLVRRF